MVNEAVKTSAGSVVCIEKGEKLRYDIKYQARLVNTEEYLVADAQSLYGFIAGILASNHDVTELFVDSALKICNNDVAAFEKFVEEIDALIAKTGTKVFMTSSMPVEEASDIIKKFM